MKKMKILWFTNTPSNASAHFGGKDIGGGWISSLETLVVERKICELSICFFYYGKSYKRICIGDVVYYGIPINKSKILKRIKSRHVAELDDETWVVSITEIINDAKPDLIHVFGTENSFGKFLKSHSDKVLFHLQGLVSPYSDVYFPLGINKSIIRRNSSLIDIILGRTFNDHFNSFKKIGNREIDTIKYWKYFSGRTSWDRNYIELLNKDACYFHVDELLRKEFYSHQWTPPYELSKNKTIVIGTTISPMLYKGLDLIYKVLALLKSHDIIWKIFGFTEDDVINKTVKDILKLKNIDHRMQFYGQVKPSELIKELQTCHFFVHPSYIDNSPNSVCEAMLLGMPVLSSSVGGVKTLIKNDYSGFLFNPYDKYDLAGLLVHLINNYEIAKQSGIRARQIALERHSPDTILNDLLKAYNHIIQNELK